MMLLDQVAIITGGAMGIGRGSPSNLHPKGVILRLPIST